MKLLLLSITALLCFGASAQNQIQSLPVGKYETVLKAGAGKWERGDIILLEHNKYKLSKGEESGDYKFSSAAQRIFFTSGPLKSLYARTSLANDAPTIVLPVPENEQAGFKLSAEVWCYYRR